MNSDQIANLAYLALMGTAVAGWFFAQNRQNIGKSMQQAMIWGFIFLGTIAGVGLWTDIQNTVAPRQSVLTDGTIEIPRGFEGHYAITLKINEQPVDFIIDTGATQMVLTQADATRIGLTLTDMDYFGVASTANGTVRTAPVTLESVVLGDIIDRGFPASVNEGALESSLLGMEYLSQFSRIEILGDTMRLTR
jgi:aspartyl protease family protein